MSDLRIFNLPEGAFFDERDMLCDARGALLPDGIYVEQDGSMFMYEGDWFKKIGKKGKVPFEAPIDWEIPDSLEGLDDWLNK